MNPFVRLPLRWARNLFLFCLCFCVLLEIILRLTIRFFPLNTQNVILSKMYVDMDAIYFPDPATGLLVHNPSYVEPDMFFNGHHWYHRTNSLGVRHERDFDTAGIVALGDSMIYGYGVDNDQTLCHVLENETGQTVANLGVIGDSPYEQYYRLKRLGLALRPKVVLFFINNFQDEFDLLTKGLTDQRIADLLASPVAGVDPGLTAADYVAHYKPMPHAKWRRMLYASLAVRFWKRGSDLAKALAPPNPDKINRERVDYHERYRQESERLGGYVESMLVDAARLCHRQGATLVVVLHPVCEGDSLLYRQTQEICERNGILLLNLNEKDLFKQGDRALFFKNYDHYNVLGNKYAASLISEFLKAQKLF